MSGTPSVRDAAPRRSTASFLFGGLAGLAVAAGTYFVIRGDSIGTEMARIAVPAGGSVQVKPDTAADAHAGHDHDHAGHSDEYSLELSEQARKSIGLREGEIKLSTFDRTIGLPGIIAERRGRSKIDLIAPMTAYVTKILTTEGAAVKPDQLLFELRLTHEELVQSQADLLRTVEELDVVRREIARLEGIGEGVVPVKTILERKYEQQKFEAVLRAQRQGIILHGLNEAQVDEIIANRTLLSTITVRVPSKITPLANSDGVVQVQELRVERGQHVTAGESLAILADHSTLLIEGEAFEQDIPQITQAVTKNHPVTAILETKSGAAEKVADLRIAYLANRVDLNSRTLHFYVTLPNRLVRDTETDESQRFIEWQYKPGQRMQLRVPVEQWADRIIVPTEAVAQDGVESYVFRANGDHFDRQTVRVEYRDPQWVVIANDGSLFPGEKIAMSAAQQLQLALKNKSGGAIDPHAGHSH
ncbi:MAG: efflux RND transporter periplasmic adaptor subunit [Planctomycetaceae bacterium]|nr:efflux RND transporter periplasmic adaptor subunit [Planctomycetaceae bacterium]